jgi:hypothetical protein
VGRCRRAAAIVPPDADRRTAALLPHCG